MEIYTELNYNPNLSLCLGFFDGVHHGHRVVIKNAVNLSYQFNLKSAVVTFKEHPLCYLQNRKPQYIFPLEERLNLIEKEGIDYVYLLDFDERIADLIAGDYLKDILIKNFSPKFITTGFNHYFGANKFGDTSFLRNNQAKYGYNYYEIPPITFNNTLISSTKIRQLILSGEVSSIKPLLGDYFYIKGVVKKGNQLGRTLSFPTINVSYPADIIQVKSGVYAGSVCFDDFEFNAMINIGRRPTVNTLKSVIVEAHILDFNDNLYGKAVKISLAHKIRDEIKFESVDKLQNQLVFDERLIRQYFSEKCC